MPNADKLRTVHEVLLRLADGDMRTTGASDEVSAVIVQDQALFDVVVEGLDSGDPGLRMRCSDAIEKASRENPERLEAHKSRILTILGESEQFEVQWHMAALVPRLSLNGDELSAAVNNLKRYFSAAESRIVRVCALQAVVELSGPHPELTGLAEQMLQEAMASTIPSLRARAKKLFLAVSKR